MAGEPFSERNTIKRNVAYSACEKAQVWVWAVELLAVMAEVRVEQGTITYSAASMQAGDWLRAMELFAELACDRAEQDTSPYSAAINACAMSSIWSRVLDLLCRMAGAGVEPNTIHRVQCNAQRL